MPPPQPEAVEAVGERGRGRGRGGALGTSLLSHDANLEYHVKPHLETPQASSPGHTPMKIALDTRQDKSRCIPGLSCPMVNDYTSHLFGIPEPSFTISMEVGYNKRIVLLYLTRSAYKGRRAIITLFMI